MIKNEYQYYFVESYKFELVFCVFIKNEKLIFIYFEKRSKNENGALTIYANKNYLLDI